MLKCQSQLQAVQAVLRVQGVLGSVSRVSDAVGQRLSGSLAPLRLPGGWTAAQSTAQAHWSKGQTLSFVCRTLCLLQQPCAWAWQRPRANMFVSKSQAPCGDKVHLQCPRGPGSVLRAVAQLGLALWLLWSPGFTCRQGTQGVVL